MGKIDKVLDLILGLPKTIYVNMHFFSLKQAIKLPILVSGSIKLGPLGPKGCIVLDKKKLGTIKFGFGGSFNLGQGGGYLSIMGKCHFKGTFSMGSGAQFIVGKDAYAEFGNRFYANANCIFNVSSKFQVGDDFLSGWNVTLIDGDGHKILPLTQVDEKAITIGNHVWLSSDAKILKGTKICDGSVVAANALVTKAFSQPNILIGGTNKILKEEICWEM